MPKLDRSNPIHAPAYRCSVGAFILLAACALPAAARAANSSWYLGAGVGEARYRLPENHVLGYLSPIISRDLHDSSYAVFGGYRFNRFFALETGYQDFGRARRILGWPDQVAGVCVPDAISACNGNRLESIEAAAYGFGARATLPISTRFETFATLGISMIHARHTESQYISVRLSDSTMHAYYGLGLRYQLNDRLGLRLKWDRFSDMSSWLNSVKTYSAGFEVAL